MVAARTVRDNAAEARPRPGERSADACGLTAFGWAAKQVCTHIPRTMRMNVVEVNQGPRQVVRGVRT